MEQVKLIRGLSLLDAFSLVAGTIIGTGIFLKAAPMAQLLGSVFWVMMAWLVAGVLSMAGALAYAEIGSRLPKAGGEYAYIRETYGDFFSFLYGWMRFWIGSPGSIAAYAVGSAMFLSGFVDLNRLGGPALVAVVIIVFFSSINCLKISFGGRLQSVLTLIKFSLVMGLAMALFAFTPRGENHLTEATWGAWPGWSPFGAALLAALWAFDGWNNLPMVGAEIKNASRNLPRSLVLGLIAVITVYLFIHLAYFYALPFATVASGNSSAYPQALPVGTLAAQTFLGAAGVGILSLLFVFSALSAMNGSIMTSARVPFAMAQDGLFVKSLAAIHPKTHVPVISIVVQGLMACGLALLGKFDQLTDYVVFASWVFYAMVTASLFNLRRRYPHQEGVYKVWAYPVLPVVFLLCSVLLLANTLYTSPKESLLGLALILTGVPVYWFYHKGKR